MSSSESKRREAAAKHFSRREALAAALASGAALGLSGAPAVAGDPDRRRDERPIDDAQRPKNIIFMVADGMSIGVPSIADRFAQLVRGRGTAWYDLAARADVAHGYAETHSLTSLVTDSAAAGSAWGAGSRIVNGAINVLPDGTELTPIGYLASDIGKRIGLVTTTRVTHATPAAFGAIAKSRNQEDMIAPQYLGKIDIVLGGGVEHFSADHRDDKQDLKQQYASAGYAVFETQQEMLGVAAQAKNDKPTRMLGLFSEDHLPYTIDHLRSDALKQRVPSLAKMTEVALNELHRSERGFLLQVEGGRIDHAAHANDAPAIMWDQLAFDDALGVALAYVERNPDTLLIVTTDHANANPGLNGTGGGYRKTNESFERLVNAKCSYGPLRARINARKGDGELTDAIVQSAFEESYGFELKRRELAIVMKQLQRTETGEVFKQHRSSVGILGQVLGNHFGIGWTGVSHTADLASAMALGPGQDFFRGMRPNTDAYRFMAQVWDIDHVNPTMSAERARSLVARAAEAELHMPWEETHWQTRADLRRDAVVL